MATTAPLAEPQARYDSLLATVNSLECTYRAGIKFKHSNWDGGAKKFLNVYMGILGALDQVKIEICREEDFKQVEGLWPKFLVLGGRVNKLLDWTAAYIGKYTIMYRPVYKELYAAVLGLSKNADHGEELFDHIIQMNEVLERIRPAPALSWLEDGSDLKPCAEFEAVYAEFGQLEKDPHNFQQQQESYVLRSYDLLCRALRALTLPEHMANPQHEEDNFFHNDRRPTYVEFPYGSDEFLYGFGARKGIFEVKANMGGAIPQEHESRVNYTWKWLAARVPLYRPPGYAEMRRKAEEEAEANARKEAEKKTAKLQSSKKNKKGRESRKRKKSKKSKKNKKNDKNDKTGAPVLPTPPGERDPNERPVAGSSKRGRGRGSGRGSRWGRARRRA
ncbi:hypothetical protein NPX13_g10704 [Xylaria arbuscula]|uniref:Uncharacterized protein n=1 Tax=Xylaria arbuscula TaxID=114810 RepID=A0A9W8N496_9PEZI|nr:hypothetical protein NPX13_g10704 [Xylaria arbuscula]